LTYAVFSSYQKRFPELKKLQEIASLYEKNYINDIDKKQLSELLAQMYMYGSGDVFAAYYSAEEWAEQLASESGNSVGIGVYLDVSEDGEICISKVMEGASADKAGLLSGDIVISVDGVSVAEVGYTNALDLLRGDSGSQVALEILRGTDVFTVDVVRSQYAPQTVFAETVMRGGNLYGLVQITEFLSVQTTFYQFKTAVDALIEYGVQGLIFDVRNNLGGDVNAVLRMLDYLLPEGEIFVSVSEDGKEKITKSDADSFRSYIRECLESENYRRYNRDSESISRVCTNAHGQEFSISIEIKFSKYKGGLGWVTSLHRFDDDDSTCYFRFRHFTVDEEHPYGYYESLYLPLPEDLAKLIPET
jgi:carboxyl-terminal processing protease